MGLAAVLSACLATAAFCAVWLHLGLDQVQQRREHFWLAIAALGVVQLAIGNGLLYEAQTADQARQAQCLALACTGPLVVGLVRFTALMTGARHRVLEFLCIGVATCLTVSALAWPDMYFVEPLRERHVEWLDLRFVQLEMTAWGQLSFLPFAANYALVGSSFLRGRSRFRHPRAILLGFTAWALCAVSDALVVHDVIEAPFLFAVGYLVFLGTFSVLLVRDLTASLDRLEAGNEELGLIVEERSAALHRKELQVAHGARMATVGTLSAGLAREIREPLGEVAGHIDAVERDFGHARDGSIEETEDETGRSIEETVNEARRGIERIRTIVSELLHVARRGGGEAGPVDVNKVVRAVLPIVRHEARDRGRLEIDLGDVPAIEGEEQLVTQILLNLVLNAIQALPETDGEPGVVTITTRAEGDLVRLQVRDTGPGIPDEIRDHVFEPFFTTKPQGEGTGLGLAVAHQLVERHRGHIEVQTGEDGTTMIVDLPAMDAMRRDVA